MKNDGVNVVHELAALSAELAVQYSINEEPGRQAIGSIIEIQLLAKVALEQAVLNARRAGATWAEIGESASCTKQNAFNRWRWVDRIDG